MLKNASRWLGKPRQDVNLDLRENLTLNLPLLISAKHNFLSLFSDCQFLPPPPTPKTPVSHQAWRFFFLFFFFFFLFIAAPSAYGGSQARGRVRATATATPDPSRVYDLHHSSEQLQILNSLSEARDRTHIFMDSSWVH